MWTKDGQGQPTPEHFDEHYLKAEGAHVDLRPEVQERLDEVLEIVGPVEGKKILDLGGGALLGRACREADYYLLVDMSKEGCRIAQQVAPWVYYRCEDVLDYLMSNSWLEFPDAGPRVCFQQPFDVTVAIGLVEYLPPAGMSYLFERCPSPVLAFTTAINENYLQYQARITVPSRRDVAEVAERFGWKVTKDLPRKDHVWSRFERA